MDNDSGYLRLDNYVIRYENDLLKEYKVDLITLDPNIVHLIRNGFENTFGGLQFLS
jgi:hypothetical protein